ncbi:MAG: TetR/AcrR family transcriptional regulator [Myxococcales bacterium]|nr:TetR/AcrR family transcriptional regulator [Myxococcales bacterium]
MGRRGRPPGTTAVGEARRERLFDVAVRLFAERGYHATTLRGIAAAADVSPGLLYRYFPSKGAVVTALYERLSETFAVRRGDMPEGRWPMRVLWTLRASLEVLQPHRDTLAAVLGVLLTDRELGLLAPASAPSRDRVMGMFQHAVASASDAPTAPEALGRVSYVAHLAVVLWMLLDRSEEQRATEGLLTLLEGVVPLLSALVWAPGVSGWLERLDGLIVDGLLASAQTR